MQGWVISFVKIPRSSSPLKEQQMKGWVISFDKLPNSFSSGKEKKTNERLSDFYLKSSYGTTNVFLSLKQNTITNSNQTKNKKKKTHLHQFL